MTYEIHVLTDDGKLVDMDGHYPDAETATSRANELAWRQKQQRREVLEELYSCMPGMLCDEDTDDPIDAEIRAHTVLTNCLNYRYVVHSCGQGKKCILWDQPTV